MGVHLSRDEGVGVIGPGMKGHRGPGEVTMGGLSGRCEGKARTVGFREMLLL